MTDLVLTDPTNGTDADATVIAANNAAIEAKINGDLDEGNLTDGAVGLAMNRGSTPPGSPTDGMLWLYSGISDQEWLFRYNAGGGTYKWEFIGGAPVTVQVATREAATNNSFVDLATQGPAITLARAGVYAAEFGASAYCDSVLDTIWTGLSVAAAAASDDVEVNPGRVGDVVQIVSARQITVTPAAQLTRVMYRTGSGNTAKWENRWLRLTPVRVA